ncbi:MAG TPA: MAPEG family protein [Candidatus Limnocylindrales bacterium]|nr:MAPEG family protein [Candidatus Limnocylindrales bacterium]
MTHPILRPAIVLVLWSLLVLLWMIGTRIPALKRHNLDIRGAVGGRGSDLDGVLPDKTQWKAHNYNNLMEQPTLFYALVLMLAILAPGDGVSVVLAWVYVVLRIVHSIWQATVNIVFYRATLFTISSVVLIALALRAAMLVLSE